MRELYHRENIFCAYAERIHSDVMHRVSPLLIPSSIPRAMEQLITPRANTFSVFAYQHQKSFSYSLNNAVFSSRRSELLRRKRLLSLVALENASG
jgi:hypothetical protein